jgi:colicin import membrane protein
MSKIRRVRWLASQASSGLKDLPRNGAWLLSRVLQSPGSDLGSGGHGAPAGRGLRGGLRRVTAAVGDVVPGVHESVETRLRRAEAAVASARKAKQQALEEAHNASDRADAAKAVAEEATQRLAQATRDGKQEVDQHRREAQEQLRQLIGQERETAERDVADRLERAHRKNRRRWHRCVMPSRRPA